MSTIFNTNLGVGFVDWNARRGNMRVVNGEVEMLLAAGADQQSVLLEKIINVPRNFYAKWTHRFPRGFSWDGRMGTDYPGEHKLFIVDTEVDENTGRKRPGRILVNLRGGGTQPELAVFFEQVETRGGVNVRGETPLSRWPQDGADHALEILVERTGGPSDRVQLWLDGQIVFDVRGRTCDSPVPRLVTIQLGAFVNQGSRTAQSFYLSGQVVIAEERTSAPPVVVPPVNPPVPDLSAVRVEIDRLVASAQNLESRISSNRSDITAMSNRLKREVDNLDDLADRSADDERDLAALRTSLEALKGRLA